MDLREFVQKVSELVEQGLHVEPHHGHAERLAQTTRALAAIGNLAGGLLDAPDAPKEEKGEG